jgi:hypothetical protein
MITINVHQQFEEIRKKWAVTCDSFIFISYANKMHSEIYLLKTLKLYYLDCSYHFLTYVYFIKI